MIVRKCRCPYRDGDGHNNLCTEEATRDDGFCDWCRPYSKYAEYDEFLDRFEEWLESPEEEAEAA